MSTETQDEPATVDEVVTEARRHCLHAIKRLRAILDNKGGRGAGSINVAARTLLETARVNGAEAEELAKMPLGEAIGHLRLVECTVDRDAFEAALEQKTREKFSADHAREQQPSAALSSPHPANRSGGAR